MIAFYKPVEMERLIELLGSPDETYPAPREHACVEVPFWPEYLDPDKQVEPLESGRFLVCDPTMLACRWNSLTLTAAADSIRESEEALAKDLLLSGVE